MTAAHNFDKPRRQKRQPVTAQPNDQGQDRERDPQPCLFGPFHRHAIHPSAAASPRLFLTISSPESEPRQTSVNLPQRPRTNLLDVGQLRRRAVQQVIHREDAVVLQAIDGPNRQANFSEAQLESSCEVRIAGFDLA
jgi:hypothetical protein